MVVQSVEDSGRASIRTEVSQAGSTPTAVSCEGEEKELVKDKREEAYESVEDDWQHDLRNPRNWSGSKKWIVVGAASFYTFVPPLSSSIMAPALPFIAEDLGIASETLLSLTLSIFLISFAFAPLLYAPLSEIYGRKWILDISNIFFLAMNLGCAFSRTTGALLAFRLMCGGFGAAPIAIGGGIIGDLFSEHGRAPAMAIYTLGPLIGPVIGPVMGGFLGETVGWKYCFILIVALAGAATVVGIPFLRETYAPVIRLRLAKGMDPEEAKKRHPHLMEAHDPPKKWRIIKDNLVRPFVLLTRSFICFVLSLYMALLYGIYYLMFSTFPDLFANTYGFNAGTSGLAYLGLGIGFFLATMMGGHLGNIIYMHYTKKNNGVSKPEYRVPALIFGSIFVPIGLFWYGWSAQAGIHWIMPIIGTGWFGFGMMASYLPCQLYLIDTFPYAASALSAAAVARSLLGFCFPLFAGQMYAALGYGGGTSLLGGLAIVLGIPFPLYLWRYGEQLRARSSLSR
ncbi:MFS general substrate transporter [Peniophora sp. CONT]|nr:MFS general substrate transporter [Peniophora sp. CONT]